MKLVRPYLATVSASVVRQLLVTLIIGVTTVTAGLTWKHLESGTMMSWMVVAAGSTMIQSFPVTLTWSMSTNSGLVVTQVVTTVLIPGMMFLSSLIVTQVLVLFVIGTIPIFSGVVSRHLISSLTTLSMSTS